jgi:hypothetical protein
MFDRSSRQVSMARVSQDTHDNTGLKTNPDRRESNGKRQQD